MGGFTAGKTESNQSSSQNVWQNQVPFLESLYKTGSDVIGKMLGQPNQYEEPARAAWERMLTGGGANPMLGETIKTAQQYAGEGFAENVLPAIQSSAIDAGSLGGSRGGIAAGMAGREAAREQSRIAESLTYGDYSRQQDRIMQALSMTGGLNSLSQSSLNPLLALAQILGKPTTLQQSQGHSEGWNFGMNVGAT